MRLVVLAVLMLGLFGCNKKTSVYKTEPGGGGGNPPAGDLDAKYAKIEGIVKASCLTSGCHAGGSIVDLRSGKALAASKSKARVSNGSMPPPASGPGQQFNAGMKADFLSFF